MQEVWRRAFHDRYKITPQTSTGVSLAELLLGRKPRSRLNLVYQEIGRKVRQASQKPAHDWHAKERAMREGEAVYASNFRKGPKWMPGVLKQLTGPTSFAVQLEDGRLLRRHQDHLIPQPSILQEPNADQEVPPLQPAEQPKLKLEKSLTQQTAPVQSAPQDIPEKRYPTRNRQAPRYLADFVTCHVIGQRHLGIASKVFVVDVIVTVFRSLVTGRNSRNPQTEKLRKHVTTLRKHNG